jgi:hypothetical protein
MTSRMTSSMTSSRDLRLESCSFLRV